jgi:glycosyltransferase involved in cell wall biosynthesis
MKLLFYGESPCLETGAGRVDRHILDVIVEMGIEVEVLGTSHFFEENYDHERYPYPIQHIQAPGAQLETHLAALREIERRAGTFDVLFISGDMHVPNIMIDAVRKYPSIVLAAIDGEVRHYNQVQSLEVARWPVVYSKYSYEQVLRWLPNIWDRFDVITLGCETDVFFPLTAEERRAYRKKAFNIDDDETFLVMCCNRNQVRKDLARSMKAFHLFHEKVPNSRLYMNCRQNDSGGHLPNQAFLCGLKTTGPKTEVIFTSPDFTEVAGYPRDILNKMYNAADVGISTAQGEGWGLTTTEFMSAGTPFIGPANTTFFEILGRDEERGYLAKCGGDDLWTIYYGMDDAPRSITSVTSMAEKLLHVYHHRSEAYAKAIEARWWCEGHTWEKMRRQWEEVLTRVQACFDEQDRCEAL